MKLLKILIGAIGGLITVFFVNTLMFTSEKITLEPLLDESQIDKEAVAQRLSQGIQFATISYMDAAQKDPQVFRDYHAFLQQSFPALHQELALEMVNELSLLYKWQGSDSSLKPMLFMGFCRIQAVRV